MNFHIAAKVPSEVGEKENVISITINNQTSEATTKYQILPTLISSVSNNNEYIGGTIEISGNNFNPAIA